MKPRIHHCIIFIFILLSFKSIAQTALPNKDEIRVYIDCNAYCPMQYVKTEITYVDFVPDRFLANVFIQITSQSTGGNGEEIKMFVSGQDNFKNREDTLKFYRSSIETEDEYRQRLVKYIKLALTPFISKTKLAEKMIISFPLEKNNKAINATENKKDKWDFWVFNIGTNGNYSKDDYSKSYQYSGRFNASRTTDKLKLNTGINYSKNKREISINNDRFIFPNDNYGMYGNSVVSINQHWSYGGSTSFSHSSYSNYKKSVSILPGLEYSFFPYKQSVKKAVTFYYEAGPYWNSYIDSSYYDKTSEQVFKQSLSVNVAIIQKWGSFNANIGWESFLNNFNIKGNKIYGTKINNAFMGAFIDVRVIKGLSVYYNVMADFTKGIYPNIRKADFSSDDILANVRQYPTSNNVYSSLGINFRFGSIYNNVVNPRFDNRGGGMRFF